MNKRNNKGQFLKENKIWEASKGYLMVWDNGRNKLLHEKVWEEYHGQKKPEGFDIHHKDENKQNNMIDNLELVTKQTHARIHAGWIRDDRGIFTAKPCSYCKKILSLDKFYDRTNYGIGYSNPSARCKTCHNL